MPDKKDTWSHYLEERKIIRQDCKRFLKKEGRRTLQFTFNFFWIHNNTSHQKHPLFGMPSSVHHFYGPCPNMGGWVSGGVGGGNVCCKGKLYIFPQSHPLNEGVGICHWWHAIFLHHSSPLRFFLQQDCTLLMGLVWQGGDLSQQMLATEQSTNSTN